MKSMEELIKEFSHEESSRFDCCRYLLLRLALNENGGNRKKTAEWLGISVRTVRNWINEFPVLSYDFETPLMKHYRKLTAEQVAQKKRMDKLYPDK